MNDALRPSDQDAIHAELRDLGRRTAFPVMFGGMVHRGDLKLSGLVGTRSQILRGLVIHAECGAGGRAIAEQRPVGVRNYAHSRTITHEYDHHVGTEGIQTLLAVPVVVRRETRGVLYGGLRLDSDLGDRAVEPVVAGATALAREFAMRDEVDRRVRILSATPRTACNDPTRELRVSEAITESYLALRDIADRLGDDSLSAEIHAVEDRLRRLADPDPAPTVRLSRRESDVLAHASLGCRNAEIAERMSLSPETVKSYMRNLMAKLEVHSRHEAVVQARRLGLLP
nr:response regulator transcription factor [Gordonia sp. LAM0048]